MTSATMSDTLRQVFATPFLSRWVFDVEIVARFRVAMAAHGVEFGPAIYEMPLREWRDIGGSKVHLADAIQAFVDLVRIRRDLSCSRERAGRAGWQAAPTSARTP